MKLAAPVHSTTVLPVHTQPNSCVFTWVVSLGGAHTTALQCICAHMAPVLTSAVSFGDLPTTLSVQALPVFSLCSVLLWSAYNNTICACITCVLTSVVSLHGLPTTLQHYLCMHGPCSHLCSVRRWSTHINTATARMMEVSPM